MQAESSQGAARGNTPPDRKRQRRDSGSAAPSPYIQPQTLQGGFQPTMAMGQQMSVTGGGQQGRMPMNGGMDGHSPGMPGQSPRTMPNGMPGHSMQRNQSKPGDGSMPPPQSPAGTSLGRKTPQAAGMSAMTPKMQNADVNRDQETPKSLRNSPNNNTGAPQPDSQNPSAPHGSTASPPTAATGGNAGNTGDASNQQAATSNGAVGPIAFDLPVMNSTNNPQTLMVDAFSQGEGDISDWLNNFQETFDISQFIQDGDDADVNVNF
ncbi:hypothetical protein CspeluHIS016_0207800 [Cutaneotrichosporon spelunceum]|uniref:Uncharacterized protein n=1 Tax=Cutaneotrichosporon spelunceum TaxID=1672016 RepID=A0AAD3TS07_9TREE|nr:hypothetical protein CspeluHIS016_0207800 [Cutaneotrichosporon spelunceum]